MDRLPGIVIHRLERSCTAEIVALLRATRRPLTLTELRLATGNMWLASEISAALCKAVGRGQAVSLPPAKGKKGKFYRWVAVEVKL